MGKSADKAFQAGRNISAKVVAKQVKFEATHLKSHAKYTADNAKNTTDAKTNVWKPANRAYGEP